MSQFFKSQSNELYGTAVSIDGSTEDIISLDLGSSDKCYRFYFMIVGRDEDSNNGLGYQMFASAKTDGISASVISTPFLDNDEDASLVTATASFSASGNSVSLQVTGVAGKTITYKAIGNYIGV